jgi:hypothetical protein
VERVVTVPPTHDGFIRYQVDFVSIDAATVSQRLVFLDSAGGTISTWTKAHTVGNWQSFGVSSAAVIPTGTVKVRVQFGVKGPGDPLVWLTNVDVLYPAQDGGDDGGVDVSITCDTSDCDDFARQECKNYDCNNVVCDDGRHPPPVCTGTCLPSDVCAVDKTCTCPSPVSAFNQALTPTGN